MSYNLFIDDERAVSWALPDYTDWGVLPWVIARSSEEALKIVQERGIPDRLALDFNLGYGDSILVFLKAFRKHTDKMPEWRCHSATWSAERMIASFVEDVFP